jgi:hypothetical protein
MEVFLRLYLQFGQRERAVRIENQGLQPEDRPGGRRVLVLLQATAALGGQAEAGGCQQLQLVQLYAHQPLQHAIHVVDTHGHLRKHLAIQVYILCTNYENKLQATNVHVVGK